MALIKLATLKSYVHATEYTDDDEILQVILDSAEDYVVRATGRTQTELLEMGGGESLPSQLILAVLMVAAARYALPEGESTQSVSEVPFGVTTMIKQFRKLADPVSEGGEE
jgi:uncharacterized phage protein (predicted DNA packaging)